MRTAQDDTPSGLPPRQRLFHAVLHGELSPAAAEAEAERLGVRPLLDRSDPCDFDPMLEDRWTLAMTIAWIVWRTPDAVREQWPAYVIGCERWREAVWNRGEGTPTFRGFEPGPLPMPSWLLLALREDYPRERTRRVPWRPRSPYEARLELWKALEQGDIEVDAIDLDSRRRVDIPASAWKSLELYPELEWDIVREDRMSRSGYEEIRFPVRQVVDAWPDRVLPDTLPPLVVPEGWGYITLSAAAQWIATKGGTRDVSNDPSVWDVAYRQLTDSIAAGEVETTAIVEKAGIVEKTGQRQKLEPALFGAIRIHHLFESEEIPGADSVELYLWASPAVDEEHWYAGFSDDLRQRRRTVWSKLMVSKVDVRKHFIYGPVPAQPRKRGRPVSTLRGPTLAEFRRRMHRGETDSTITGEAQALQAWQKETCGKTMAQKYIENLIRDEYARHFGDQKME